ncbi:hypothetical protein [Pseudomonas siliginis]|uniref:hypothetical protein n=1 Tax=Pseudomonas siliginis TaxID=2842346 RepID=UPI0020938357|nr:hypothetical protein [Pseudomonas siliginis]UST77174.1 hypothetical protein NF676_00475 [Pseudomonas siliginis]
MRVEDQTVREAIICAGFGDKQLVDRGDLYIALSEIMQLDSAKYSDFVEKLRGLLEHADKFDKAEVMKTLAAVHPKIKSCPCGRKPAIHGIEPGTDPQVVCLHEDEAIVIDGETLADAVANWNCDDWTLSVVRATFALE